MTTVLFDGTVLASFLAGMVALFAPSSDETTSRCEDKARRLALCYKLVE